MPSATNSPITQKQKIFTFLFILLGSFLAFGNTLGFDFVWDDLILIVDNDGLRKWSNLGAFFTTPFFKLAAGMDFPHHRPMVSLLILLTSTFSGLNPFGYHLLNVTLHAVVSWLFYLFLQKIDLKEGIRILATGIFLFHPVHAEVVAWPCSATVLVGGICFLEALIFSSRLPETSGNSRALCLLGVIAAYAIGLLSYDLVFIVPFIILFYDTLRPSESIAKKDLRVRILEFAVLSLAALDFLWMRYRLASQMGGFARFQHGDPNAANILLNTASDGLMAIPNILTRYTELLIFPMVLSPEAYFSARNFSASAIASLLLFVILTGFVLSRRKENSKSFIFSLGWMAAAFLPLIQLIFQGGLFADRYIYFASMGFALWLAIVLENIWEVLQAKWKNLGTRTAIGMAILLCLVYGAKTFEQNKIWHDDLTFWTAASIISPEKPRAQHLRGVSLLRFGHPEEAIEAFQKAIKLSPFYPHPYKGIAIALRGLGKTEEADKADRVADQMYEVQIQALRQAQLHK